MLFLFPASLNVIVMAGSSAVIINHELSLNIVAASKSERKKITGYQSHL